MNTYFAMANRGRLFLLVIGTSTMLLGCSNGGGGTANTGPCETVGLTEACVCPNGEIGQQVCGEGLMLGPCLGCPELDGSAPFDGRCFRCLDDDPYALLCDPDDTVEQANGNTACVDGSAVTPCSTLAMCCQGFRRGIGIGDSCAECLPQFTGPNCDQCAERFAGPDCTDCVGPFSGPRCEECANQNFTGPLCDQCANPLLGGSNCDECSDPRFRGPNCDTCNTRFTGPACDECEAKFTGPNCQECRDSRFTGDACDRCSDPRYTGENCDRCINEDRLEPECTAGRLRLSYIKSTVDNNGDVTIGLRVYDFQNDREYDLSTDPVIECDRLCSLNPNATWLAWLGANGALSVASVRIAQGRVEVGTPRRIADNGVRFFELTDLVTANANTIPQIVYTSDDAMGNTARLSMYAEPLNIEDANRCTGASGPYCRQSLGNLSANGSFRVSRAGGILLADTQASALVLEYFDLETGARRSIQTIDGWHNGDPQRTDFIPMALSPDHARVSLFGRGDSIWRAHTVSVDQGDGSMSLELFEAANHPDGDCTRMGNLAFNEVRYAPVFSRNSASVYFLARGDCSRRGNPPTNRDDYDVLRLDPLPDGAVENVTNNLRASHWSNHTMSGFALSPLEDKLAFVSEPPNDWRSSAIWLMDPETGEYDCSRNEPLSSIDGRERCTFIVGESASSSAYRALRFHWSQIE